MPFYPLDGIIAPSCRSVVENSFYKYVLERLNRPLFNYRN